jgi:cytochrome c oxidase cbb3-type subunit 1
MTDASSARPAGVLASDEIDNSCRLPLFVMFVSAAVWLLIASIFALISTIKFHNPNFLANTAWLTYGRVRAAYFDAAIYGFCLQSGLGVALWLIARLGRTVAAYPLAITIGAALFNLGVTIGFLGILGGDATGFQNLDFPGYAAASIFLGYLLIGIPALITFDQRKERALFASQWFLLAALFWFPWIYSTAELLLILFPVRGVTQAIIAWWFSNNFLWVWLGLIGIASIFYFIPKLISSELYSRYLALLTFWCLILFGSWSGIPTSAPVPAWMPAMSTVATVLMLLAAVALAMNVYGTLQGQCSKVKNNAPFQFIWLGTVGFLLTIVLNIIAALPPVSDLAVFTWFTSARAYANFYGFFSLTMFGAIYYIFPRLAGFEFPFAKLIRAHLFVAVVGVCLVILPLAIGGLIQGWKMKNPDIAFTDVSKASLHFLRISTIGDLLIALGHVLFLFNLAGIVNRFLQPRAVAGFEAATADLFHPAEARR